jgi:hypothetical protein
MPNYITEIIFMLSWQVQNVRLELVDVIAVRNRFFKSTLIYIHKIYFSGWFYDVWDVLTLDLTMIYHIFNPKVQLKRKKVIVLAMYHV